MPAAPAVAAISETQQQTQTTTASTMNSDGGSSSANIPPPAASDQPPLLREWSSNPHPPVAPAVVLNEVSADVSSSDDPGSGQEQPKVYSYPVATFVSNLVRTTVDGVRDHLGNSHVIASAVPAEDHSGAETSIRSTPAFATAPAATAEATATARSLDMIDRVDADESAEFVLIDGDLVALPAPAPNAIEQEEMEFWRQHELRKCETRGRMKKGVKGIFSSSKKWIKKKKLKGLRLLRHHQDQLTQQVQEGHERSSQEIAATVASSQFSDDRRVGDDGALSIEASASMTSSVGGGAELSPNRHKKQKKKKRLPWLRDIERNGDSQSSSQRKRPAEANPLPPVPPAAAEAAAVVETTPIVTPAPEPEITTLPPSELTPLPPSDLLLNRSASIAAEASFIGTADQLLEAGVLPGDSVTAAEAYIEDRFDDYDKYDKKDDGFPYLASVVPRDADYKVDKQDAPCVESMLVRAGEFAQDLEASACDFMTPPPSKVRKLKSDGGSVPLSMATLNDKEIHNDTLKLVMVGAPDVDKSGLARSLRKSTKKPRKRTTLGVDVHSWTPMNEEMVKFSIWDVHGAKQTGETTSANFGAHPGTQSLFFSDRSLYLLVWDLAAYNRRTHRKDVVFNDESDDEEEYENEYLREQANRQADLALQNDIEDRVLSWVDCVARRGANSAILPVALVPSNMTPEEAKRRCDTMQTMMMDYTQQLPGGLAPPKVLAGAETMICVSLETDMGMDLLEETILAIANDVNHSVFDHVGTPVPRGAVHVLEAARRLKHDHKLVLLDQFLFELSSVLTVEEVMESLHFLSCIGELLYFGGSDEVLSRYVILSRKWLVSALSCILRNDLKRELAETRRFMNMQCIYSDQQFQESHVTQTFSTSSSNCPVLSSSDTQMLWQSMSFMREAADKSSQLSETSTSTITMFSFLERLLVHTGVFLPLEIDQDPFSLAPPVYFVPSLLSQTHTPEVWTYKSSDAWLTTLSSSWLFRDGAPLGLMEHVTVALLRDLYEFSRTVSGRATLDPHPPVAAGASHAAPGRSQSFPLARNSLTDFIDAHDGEAIGHIKIHQIMCWKSSLLVKIGCVFPDGNVLRESFVEIFVAIVDQTSPHCVAADAMGPTMQRLIVNGKGQVGHHGRKLWKGGYALVLDSIKASVAHCPNVDRQVVCPECLAHAHPNNASTWSWDSVRAAAESGSSMVRCIHGHRVDANLICGTCKPAMPKADHTHVAGHGSLPKQPVRELLPSVVVVGLWDSKTNVIRNVGSGFVADKKAGLVVTAGHILFNMEHGRQFGAPYFGVKHAKAIIGVIPEDGSGDTAVFRYFAEIVADDIHNVDACVLKITTRLDKDVDSDAQIAGQPEHVVNVQREKLHPLKMTRRYELEESVRILGFNQGGEGMLEQGKHVNRSADFAKGYICKQFKMADDNSSSSESSSSESGFSPREEIVIMCPTISGHSGGPCVNDEGKVVGILSRADPVDRQRCYLVPSTELKTLVNKAKKNSNLGVLKLYTSI